MAIQAPQNTGETQQALQDTDLVKKLKAEEEKVKAAILPGNVGGKQAAAVSAVEALKEINPTPPVVAPSFNTGDAGPVTKAQLDFQNADRKIESIDLQLEGYKGKENMNPFIWMGENKWDVIKGLIKSRSAEGLALLSRIPDRVVPSVNKNKILPDLK